LRVEWIVFYDIVGKENAALTAKQLRGISRKTFLKWFRCFKDPKYNVKSWGPTKEGREGRQKESQGLPETQKENHPLSERRGILLSLSA
jgi:hypothetical protein